jgi:glycosyltransferase involved in cell wall biosynthesis
VGEYADYGRIVVKRIAIVTTHPIQYYAPWFRYLVEHTDLHLRVFFLLTPAETGLFDQGFQRVVKWDLPLLDGYSHEFVQNTSARPGPGRFWGFRNPELKKRVLAFQPDVVLLIGYNYWSLVSFILTWRARHIPLIFRGDSHRIARGQSIMERIRRGLIAFLFRRFSAFLYVGQANYRYFIYHGVSRRSLFHAPHAIDIQRFAEEGALAVEAALTWRRSLGITDERLVVLFAGKFEDKKRPLDLLRAFKSLDTRAVSLLFVGDGPLEGALREEARGCDSIHFAPFQNQSLMPRTYAACDVLVLPSYGPFETWGLAVNEAMSVGKPVIVSTHVGCAEDLVQPRTTGLVFEAGSKESLAQALSTIFQSKQLLGDWGAAAKEHVRAFSYAEASKGLLAAVASVSPCVPRSSTRSLESRDKAPD